MIPSAALLQHVAILGKTGSGKTYTANGLVEGILDDKRRLAVVDPTGAWWGLRSSADGKAAGYPVIVLGGQHGDAPLPPESGAACEVCRKKIGIERNTVAVRAAWARKRAAKESTR